MRKRKAKSTKISAAAQLPKITVRPGWICQDVSRATGGVRYVRTPVDEASINNGRGLRTEVVVDRTIDHVEVCAALDACAKRVQAILRKHGTRIGDLGWFADDAMLAKINNEIAQLQDEATELNQQAKRLGSERRVRIKVVPLRMEPAMAETVEEVARVISYDLRELRGALHAGTVAELPKLLLRARNLHKLATGIQSDSIYFALRCAVDARRDLKSALRDGADPAQAGAALDLNAIDAAIQLFAPSFLQDEKELASLHSEIDTEEAA